jgi:polysaccharide biosynthesis protein PslA
MNAHFGSLGDVSFTAIEPNSSNTLGLSKRTCRLGIYTAMIIMDALSVMIGFLASNALLLDNPLATPGLKLGFLSVPIFLAIALNNRAYGRSALYNSKHGTSRSILSLFATLGSIVFVLFGLSVLKPHHPSFIALGFIIASVLIGASRQFCHRLAEQMLGKNPISELIIVDGVPHSTTMGQNVIDARKLGLRPNISCPHMLNRLGNLFQSVDRVVVACSEQRHGDWILVLKSTGMDGEVHRNFRSAPAAPFANIPIDPSQVRPLTRAQLLLKRTVDLILVSLALIFLAPLMILTAIAIKLESPGPVLFKQQRLGHCSRLFHIYKFRSMRIEQCDATGAVSTMPDDTRITRVGRFIRMTSIDELPQLFNVLAGSMSMVGPRPHALGSMANSKLFWDIDRNYWLRHAAVPGLTGLAQVRGFRGATLSQADLENRLAADLEYIQCWSLGLDLQILARTFGVIIHRNAY